MSEAIWITAIDLSNLEDTHPETEPWEVRRRETNARPCNLRVSAARCASALSPAARPTSQSGSKVSVPSMSTNRIFSAQPGAGLPQDFSRLIRVDVPTSCRLAVPSLETVLRHRFAIGMCRKMLRGRDRVKHPRWLQARTKLSANSREIQPLRRRTAAIGEKHPNPAFGTA